VTASPMNDLLLGEMWSAVRTRLDSATMRGICNPTSDADKPCVYVAGIDDFEDPEGPEAEDWGRVVVQATDTLWPVAEMEGATRKLGFVVRTEFNNLKAEGYSAFTGLELSQQEAYRLLQRWTPTGFASLLVGFGLYRFRAPQPTPQRDDERGLLLLSSEFRFEAAGAP
jgi:hypothetical protein